MSVSCLSVEPSIKSLSPLSSSIPGHRRKVVPAVQTPARRIPPRRSTTRRCRRPTDPACSRTPTCPNPLSSAAAYSACLVTVQFVNTAENSSEVNAPPWISRGAKVSHAYRSLRIPSESKSRDSCHVAPDSPPANFGSTGWSWACCSSRSNTSRSRCRRSRRARQDRGHSSDSLHSPS